MLLDNNGTCYLTIIWHVTRQQWDMLPDNNLTCYQTTMGHVTWQQWDKLPNNNGTCYLTTIGHVTWQQWDKLPNNNGDTLNVGSTGCEWGGNWRLGLRQRDARMRHLQGTAIISTIATHSHAVPGGIHNDHTWTQPSLSLHRNNTQEVGKTSPQPIFTS